MPISKQQIGTIKNSMTKFISKIEDTSGGFIQDTFVKIVTKTDFPRLWVSQLLSQVSLHLINFLIILRIFEATRSSVAISLVWVFYALPAIILGPFSGTIIDLASRRKLLIGVNIAQAVVVLFYLPAQEAIWPIYSVIFIYALLNQIFIPAEAAILPFLVPKNLLPAANSLFVFTIYASFLLGFSLAGPLIKVIGERTPFLVISLLLVFAAVVVYGLPEDKRKKKVRRPNEFWERLVQGYEFIEAKPMVLFPLLLIVASWIVIPMIAVLAPAIAVKVLGIPLVEASMQVIAPAALGAIVGAFFVVRLLRGVRKKRVISWGIFLAAISLLWVSLVIPNVENKMPLGLAAAFSLGVSFTMTIIPAQTMLQEQTPDELRGRVFGALNFLVTSVSILPVLFAATLAEFFGEIALLMLISFLLFAIGILSLNSESLVRLYAKR